VPGALGPFLESQFPTLLEVGLIDSLALFRSLLIVDVGVDLVIDVETAAVDVSGTDAGEIIVTDKGL
jgi:hypothetical protein